MARSFRPRQLAPGLSLVAVFLASMVFVSPVSASTAQVVGLSTAPCKPDQGCSPSPPGTPPETALIYLGGREANRVTLSPGAQQIRIADRAAQIDPGPGCSRVEDHTVSCSVPGVLVYIATGGGSDRVTSEPASVTKLTLDGGAGNDLLVGGAGPDVLLGGRGADRLRGRGGSDRLFDASSREPLRAGDQSPSEGGSDAFFGTPLPAGRGGDSFDGGSGSDTLSYRGRLANLRIDLASTKRISGAHREHDSIRRIENAVGGGGSDRIAGNRKANVLKGDGEQPGDEPAGDDRIAGRAGNDSIEGGLGRNVLSGGPGDDTLANGRRNSCGRGTDSVGDFAPRGSLSFLAPDCERPMFDFLDALLGGPLDVRSVLPLREGRPPRILAGRLGCFLNYVCQVTSEVRARSRGTPRGTAPPRGTLLGSQSFTVGANETKTLDLRLSPQGLRRLRRHRSLRVSVSLTTQHSDLPGSYVTLLRGPRR